MSSVLDAFRSQPFELEPVLASWTDAPRFVGKPKKDLPVNDWLDQIKVGCVARKVPRDCWHRVGEHFLGGKAKIRFDEVKLVMQNMHAGKYKWNWKNFKVAMRNMGWEIASDKTEKIKVQSKPSGLWWIAGRGDSDKEAKESSAPPPPVPPKPKRSNSVWEVSSFKGIPVPKRSATMNTIETISSDAPSSNKSIFSTPFIAPSTTPAGTPGETTTTVAQAPIWLLNVCQSLDFLTSEHPKVMTAISAVLITVGSLPAIPALTAGAGGAFLASSTAHALGTIAVGLGTLLRASGEGHVHVQQPHHGS